MRMHYVKQSSSICLRTGWFTGSSFALGVRHFLRLPMRNESHLCSLGIFINFIYITCAERVSRLRHGPRKHDSSLCCCASVAAAVAAPAQRQSHSYFCSPLFISSNLNHSGSSKNMSATLHFIRALHTNTINCILNVRVLKFIWQGVVIAQNFMH